MSKEETNDGPFKFETAEESPGFLLWQVTTLWQRAIRNSLKDLELTQVQYVILASLAWLGKTSNSISQVGLARHAKLDVMMTSQVLRTLEQRGFLKREKDPTDPRANILSLTKEGQNMAEKAIPVVEEADHDFFSPVNRTEASMNTLLAKLISKNG